MTLSCARLYLQPSCSLVLEYKTKKSRGHVLQDDKKGLRDTVRLSQRSLCLSGDFKMQGSGVDVSEIGCYQTCASYIFSRTHLAGNCALPPFSSVVSPWCHLPNMKSRTKHFVLAWWCIFFKRPNCFHTVLTVKEIVLSLYWVKCIETNLWV